MQGVGFRYFVQRTAVGIGLAGWVRNRGDGSVEALAEGSEGLLARLRTALEQGPPLSRVERIQEHPVGPSGAEGFRITG